MRKLLCLALLAVAAAAQTIELEPPPRWEKEPSAAAKFTPPAPRASDWINTSNRAAVSSFYLTTFAPLSQVPMGFTGNVGAGNAGTTSSAYRNAVLGALNWFRSMAGVPSLSGFDPTANSKSQQAALMMSANKALSHGPPPSWTHYTAAGAEAAGRSNLCLQYSNSAFMPGCIATYIKDNGGGNFAVGHRRWMLYPQTQIMGTGDVDGRSEPSYYPLTNALWVIDDNFGGTRPATRDNFVAWPPRGYVPYQTVYPRWSISVAGANFSQASVTVRINGSPVSAPKEPLDQGYGENTLVFIPQFSGLQAGMQDMPAEVTVSNVGVNGQTVTYQYLSILFDPAVAGGPSPAALGVYSDGSWFLDRNGDFLFSSGSESKGWGSPGDQPVRGDWNGDGLDDLGVYSGGTWLLDRNGDGVFQPASEILGWGAPGFLPMPGDWNGDGVTDLGVFDPASMTWFLDLNGDRAFDPATEIVGWGSPGDTAVVGDWDGDGSDSVGVFSGGAWFIDRNGDRAFNPATEIVGWGVAGWTPLVGDWNGDGADDLGAVNPANLNWFRDLNGDYVFDPATEVVGWGPAGSTPVVADWDGDGSDDLGVFLDGTWFIDLDGDGVFDGPSEIKGWGVAGWTPVAGRWQ